MDRKMDSGYLEPGETMQDEYNYSKVLLPEEVMGIIDQLLLHEVRIITVQSTPLLRRPGCMAYGPPALTDDLHQLVY
jgi:hypothetical protein